MPKFTIYKSLLLEVKVDAATAQEAFDKMLDMDDNTFGVVECEYEMYDMEGNEIHVDMGN